MLVFRGVDVGWTNAIWIITVFVKLDHETPSFGVNIQNAWKYYIYEKQKQPVKPCVFETFQGKVEPPGFCCWKITSISSWYKAPLQSDDAREAWRAGELPAPHGKKFRHGGLRATEKYKIKVKISYMVKWFNLSKCFFSKHQLLV